MAAITRTTVVIVVIVYGEAVRVYSYITPRVM